MSQEAPDQDAALLRSSRSLPLRVPAFAEAEIENHAAVVDEIADLARFDAVSGEDRAKLAEPLLDRSIEHSLFQVERTRDIRHCHPAVKPKLQNEALIVRQRIDVPAHDL